MATRKEKSQAKVEREKQERLQQNQLKAEQFSLEKAFTYTNMYQALKDCRKGVWWKGSVQSYYNNAVIEIHNTIQCISQHKLPEFTSNYKMYIYERGKKRTITPITIKDRIVQRVICDHILLPAIEKSLIYDNGASLKNKGVDFSRQRTLKLLEAAKHKYGNDFYVLKFDFKSYFDSIPHWVCRDVLLKYVHNEETVNFIMEIIKSYKLADINQIEDEEERQSQIEKLNNLELCGICLGSQISQILALIVPNEIDHYIKDVLGIKFYSRYMDDGTIFSDDKDFLRKVYGEMENLAAQKGLAFSKAKTHIIKVSDGFTFLKVRYAITSSGKIVRKLDRSGIVRMRRNLKKYYNKVKNGEMTLDDVYNSMQSWIAHAEIAESYKDVQQMLKLYDTLFGGYKLTAVYFQESKRGHRLSKKCIKQRKKSKKKRLKRNSVNISQKQSINNQVKEEH